MLRPGGGDGAPTAHSPGMHMPRRREHASPMGLRKGSIIIGSKAAISPQEYLEHVDAVRSAWRYAAAQTIHDIRLAKRMKKQKKYGHFSIEQWGKTSRVFEKFFWFRSHMFIQYFLQGAVFVRRLGLESLSGRVISLDLWQLPCFPCRLLLTQSPGS